MLKFASQFACAHLVCRSFPKSRHRLVGESAASQSPVLPPLDLPTLPSLEADGPFCFRAPCTIVNLEYSCGGTKDASDKRGLLFPLPLNLVARIPSKLFEVGVVAPAENSLELGGVEEGAVVDNDEVRVVYKRGACQESAAVPATTAATPHSPVGCSFAISRRALLRPW